MASLHPSLSSNAREYEPKHSSRNEEIGVDIIERSTVLEVESLAPNKINNEEMVGVCLTWKDLWVTVSKGRNGSRAILQGLTLYATPGQLLAIMGPSGCGKSTLIDTLAGRENTTQTGEILVNGYKQALAYGTSACVTQDVTLMTTLASSERPCTIQLSSNCQTQCRSRRRKKEQTSQSMKWGSKTPLTQGISGAQMRRVSICKKILTRPRLLFLDEPTSGLDSAASYYFMSRTASLDQREGIQRTIIASIHQPSTEVFQLFDNLCILSSGITVHFGPASAANEFFTCNSFPCPALQNPSDHFLKTINKDFDQDIEAGSGRKTTEEAINILVNSYKSAEINQEVQAALCKKDSNSVEKKKKHASFLSYSVPSHKKIIFEHVP